MAFLPRARERVRPWPARVFVAVALAALLSLPVLTDEPPAYAKKDDPLGLLGHKGKKAELPEVPEVKLPEVKVPKVKVPKVKVPKVKVPKVDPAPVTNVVAPTTASVPSTPTPAAKPPAPASSTPGRTVTGRDPATRSAPKRRAAGGVARRPSAAVPTAARPTHRARARRHAAPAPARHRGAAPKPAAHRQRVRHKSDQGGVAKTVRELVEVVPASVKAAITALACLSVVLGGGYLLSLIRARRLNNQRGELLQEVGLLQAALLPPVPETLGGVRPSVAYRPADGPAAGGDFYDALELPGGRAGFILGDVSGHGRDALARTAFVRYTLRAFLEAGLQPREALQVAARVVGGHLGGEFATVLLAVHDPVSGSLTWASAGHPAPIVLGPERFHPVTMASSPPVGMGLESGFRQTTVPLPAGSIACMFTDGLIEARIDGDFLGRDGLEETLAGLGNQATAGALIEQVAARSGSTTDDMAACLLTPAGDTPPAAVRREEIVVSAEDVKTPLAARFLDACGLDEISATAALAQAHELSRVHGGAVLAVSFGRRRVVEVRPRRDVDEQGIVAASRRAAAA